MSKQDFCWGDADYEEKIGALSFDDDYASAADKIGSARPDAHPWIESITSFFAAECPNLQVIDMNWTNNLKPRMKYVSNKTNVPSYKHSVLPRPSREAVTA